MIPVISKSHALCQWLVAALLNALLLFPATAQESDTYGRPDTSNIAYSDYTFMRGEWQAAMVMIGADGSRTPLENSAHITGFYHKDGRTFQTCFEAPGFHSTDIRAFDEKNGVWRAHFLNARAGRWSGSTSRKLDGAMETLVPGGYAGTADFDIKTVVSELTMDSFVNNVFQRTKGTESWLHTYEMTYSRQPNNPDGPRC